jgi:hypothetical protein
MENKKENIKTIASKKITVHAADFEGISTALGMIIVEGSRKTSRRNNLTSSTRSWIP